MRLPIVTLALLLASCTSTPTRLNPQIAAIVANVSESKTLSVSIRNRDLHALEYAWPIAMASEDRSPTDCPIPTDFEYEIYTLAPNQKKLLRLDGWEHTGFVGIWVRSKGADNWTVAWSQ